MNKKAQSIWGVVIGVILFAVLVGIIVFVIIFGDSLKGTQNQKIDPQNVLKLYLESRDSRTQNQIESEYALTLENGTLLSEGKLDKNSLLEIKDIPKEQKINIYCFNGNHYLAKYQKIFTQVEKDNNASKFTCFQDPLSNLKIIREGNINDTNNIIIFNISSDSFRGLSASMSWTSGIINVDFKDNTISCDSEQGWLNYSYYNNETKVYSYLPTKNYICGYKVRECDSIKERSCILKETILSKEIDKAISTGRDLNKESYELILYVKTEDIKTKEDYLEIRFYDKDLVYIGNGQFQYLSELNERDVGNTEFVYRIYYGEDGI